MIIAIGFVLFILLMGFLLGAMALWYAFLTWCGIKGAEMGIRAHNRGRATAQQHPFDTRR